MGAPRRGTNRKQGRRETTPFSILNFDPNLNGADLICYSLPFHTRNQVHSRILKKGMNPGKEHRGTATKRRRLDSSTQLFPRGILGQTTAHLDDGNLNIYTNESSLSYIQDRLGMGFLDTGSNTNPHRLLPTAPVVTINHPDPMRGIHKDIA